MTMSDLILVSFAWINYRTTFKFRQQNRNHVLLVKLELDKKAMACNILVYLNKILLQKYDK